MIRTSRLIAVIIFFCASYSAVLSQTDPAGGWNRVQSDNGEFSIEIPADYSYFIDADGFVVGHDNRDFAVRDMQLLNAYSEGTLVSFEIYRADSDAQTELLNATLERGVRPRKIKYRDIEMKEVVRDENKNTSAGEPFYFVSRYFRSKEFVYVLSCLSRNGETAAMTRFFDSLKFTPDAVAPSPGIRRLTELKLSTVDVKTIDPPIPISNTAGLIIPKTSPDPNYTPMILASKPRAAYVRSARNREVTGAVRLRIVLASNGFTPKIDVTHPLPEGLVRQAIFAALRIKFLPAERDGKLINVAKTLEYTFSIY